MCQIMLSTQASDVSLANGRPSSQTNIFTALVYGLSLLVNVWAFFRISGGLFNPAVCIMLLITVNDIMVDGQTNKNQDTDSSS
jgi:aquaporin related protein